MVDGSDHLPHVVAALSKRGIADSIIGFYVQRWEAVTRSAAAVPCPFCFFAGHTGTLSLSPEPRSDGNRVMRCGRCEEEIEVPGR